MSDFEFKAKNKETGDVKVVTALDDYFGLHRYAYAVGKDVYLDHEEFYRDWERVEDVEVAPDKRVEEIHKAIQDEVAGEMWYESRQSEEKLQQVLVNLENRLVRDFTQHHQDLMSEAVERLEDFKNKQTHQSDRMLITEAQNIIKTLTRE